MKLKKLFALLTAGAMMTGLAACGSNGGTAGASVNDAASGDATVIQVGFENSISEPFGQGLVKWQELVDEKSNGTLKIELFPDSQLGSKAELIDSMLLSEPVVTLADGAFYADYGVPDFGIVFGPFLFDSWDECWTQIESDITGQVIEVPKNEEAPCLGAAIIGAVSEGFFPSYEDAVRECISIKRRYEPSGHEKYRKTYEVFETVYDALARAYRMDAVRRESGKKH